MDQVDLSKIPCIPHPKSLAIMNQYLLSATQHINKMSDYSEKELLEIDFLIDQLQNKVDILQRKIGITSHSQEGQDPQTLSNPPQSS